MQLRFAHDPRQAQEKPVMIGLWIVQPFAVGNQHPKQRAQLEELMPIAVVTSQTRRIQAHYQASFTQADFRDQVLETESILARRPGLAKIIIDDLNPLTRPTERDGAFDQPILQLGALLVMTHLARR